MADFEDTNLDDIDLSDFNFDNLTDTPSSDEANSDNAFADAFAIGENATFVENAMVSPFQTEELPVQDNQSYQEPYFEAPEETIVSEDEPVYEAEPTQDFSAQEAVEEPVWTSEEEQMPQEPETLSFQEEQPFQEEPAAPVYTQPEADFSQASVGNDFAYQSQENTAAQVSDTGIVESSNIGFLRWYNGASSDKLFEIKKGFESGRFQADEEQSGIHVNAGYDTYGWSVQFADGVVMNLKDVREYQIRNGRLPYSDGRIIYGKSTLDFVNVERIVVYESVKYFSYGV